MSNKKIRVWSWREAVLESGLPTMTQLVLHSISVYMNAKGEGAYPSYNTLAEKIGVARITIIRHINTAVEEGFLKKMKRKRQDGSQSSNIYEATYPDWAVNGEIPSGITGDTTPSITRDTPNNTPSINTPSNNNPPMFPPNNSGGIVGDKSSDEPEPTKRPEESDFEYYNSDFETLWSDYPRDSGPIGAKHGALESYTKARMGTLPDQTKFGLDKATHKDLMEGLNKYKAMLDESEQRAKHTKTWINQLGWLEEYEGRFSSEKSKKNNSKIGEETFDDIWNR